MGRRPGKVTHLRVLAGVASASMGVGMLLVLIIPGWGYVVAAALIIIGIWIIYTCM